MGIGATHYPGLTVAEWCQVYGKGSRARLAKATGLNWKSIDQIAKGKSVPTPETACAIEIATCGQVRAERSLGLDLHRKRLQRKLEAVRAHMQAQQMGAPKRKNRVEAARAEILDGAEDILDTASR